MLWEEFKSLCHACLSFIPTKPHHLHTMKIEVNQQLLHQFLHETLSSIHNSHLPYITTSIDGNGVLNLLNGLDTYKAPGSDKIPTNFPKMCNTEIARICTFIYQVSVQQFAVPSDWKQANIV